MTELKSHENNIAKFDITVSAEDFEKACNDVYRANKSRYRVDGFRKGHVPRKIIEGMYGPEVFYDDAINKVFFKPYEAAVEELGLEVIDKPTVDFDEIKKGEDVVFKVEVEIKPHPVLGDYSVLEVEEVSSEVTDEDVEAKLNQQREENARLVPVEEGEAQMGDTVNIDFDGFLDGVEFEGGKAENYDLELGSHSFVDTFEDQLVGHKVGDKVEVKVTFPEDYQAKDLAGKEALFHVDINKITRKEYPEIDDEFAKDISEFDTLDELKESIRKGLVEEKEEEAKNIVQNEVIEALIEKSEVTAPDPLVDQEIDYQLQGLNQNLSQMGISLDQYVQMTGMEMSALRDQYRLSAAEKVKADLVVDEVALKEGFDATDEEIEAEIKDAADQYGVEDYDKFKDIFMKNVGRETVVENLKRRKAVEFLADKAKFVPKKEEEDKDSEENKED